MKSLCSFVLASLLAITASAAESRGDVEARIQVMRQRLATHASLQAGRPGDTRRVERSLQKAQNRLRAGSVEKALDHVQDAEKRLDRLEGVQK